MTKRQIALLRGINVGGKNKIPMAELRAICIQIGFEDVSTWIQSGNVVLSASESGQALELRLEKAIAQNFGYAIPVVARAAPAWDRYIDGNPFLDKSAAEPDRVLMYLSKRPPKTKAVSALLGYAAATERIAKIGDAIWVYYGNGIARSKLAPAVLDRHVGSSVTGRNWRTVLKLRDMVFETTGE